MKSSPPSSTTSCGGGSEDRVDPPSSRPSGRTSQSLASRSHSPVSMSNTLRVSRRGSLGARRSRSRGSGQSGGSERQERTSYADRASASGGTATANPLRRFDSLEGQPRISQQRERSSTASHRSSNSSSTSRMPKPPLTPGSMGMASPSGMRRGHGSGGHLSLLSRKGGPKPQHLGSRSSHARTTAVPSVSLLNMDDYDDSSSSFGDDDSGPKKNPPKRKSSTGSRSVWQVSPHSKPMKQMPRRVKSLSGPTSAFYNHNQANQSLSGSSHHRRVSASMCGGSGVADTITTSPPSASESPPHARASAPGAISNFHSNSLRPSQFSGHSILVARQFLEDDSEQSSFVERSHQSMTASMVDRFQQSHSTTSFHKDSFCRDETEPSYVHDMSESVLQHSMNVTDFEWNPESQRRQQEEWRKLQHHQQQNHPSSKTASQDFFQRPDLRQVDQSVNLMDQSLGDYGDPFKGNATVASGDPLHHQNDNPNKNQKRRGKKKKHRDANHGSSSVGTSSSFFSQSSLFSQASNWVDEYLEERSINSSSKNRQRKKSRNQKEYYREQSCCQDLFCSRMTIILIIAALVGALIAWQTGAFLPSNNDGEEEQQQQQQGVVPVDQDSAMNGNEGTAATIIEHQEQGDDTNLLLDLLSTDLDLKSVIVEGGVSTLEELETPGTPQYLAHHWVTHLEDPTLLLTTPPVMDENQHSTALNQAMLEAYALAVVYYGGNGYLSRTYTVDDEEASLSKTIWKDHTNWLRPTPICHWYGIDCENEDDGGDDHRHHIVHLNLAQNNIKGYLPVELKVLSDLRMMDLSYNGFMGQLPEDMFLGMSQLEELSLHHNSLTGTLPTTVGNMTNLRSFQLYKNELVGTLPLELDKLTSLTVLGLQQNKFEGKIPYLGHLKDLEYLLLQENRLSLHVPFEIFRLLNLVELSIEKNKLTGTIPPEVESCGNLRKLKVDNNELSGHLPDIFFHLTNLVELRVHNNKLEGSMPESFGSLSNLEFLTVDHNSFTGTIPVGIADLTKLTEFRAYFNKLTGQFPPEICDLKQSHALEFVAVDCSEVIECDCCDDCF